MSRTKILKVRGLVHVPKRNDHGEQKVENGRIAWDGEPGNSRGIEFIRDSGKKISVCDHFADRHNKRLEHPEDWLLDCGTQKKPCYIPAELATIVKGQKYRGKLNEHQRSIMDELTRKRSGKELTLIEREKIIGKEKVLRVLDIKAAEMGTFDVKTDPNKFAVQARKLDIPGLKYGNNDQSPVVEPKVAAWNVKNRTVYAAAAPIKWKVLNFDDLPVYWKTPDFAKELNLYGLRLRESKTNDMPNLPCKSDFTHRQFAAAFNELAESGVRLLLIILPSASRAKTDDTHATIKFLCDHVYGIHTICLKRQMLEKLERSASTASHKFQEKQSEKNEVAIRKAKAAKARYYASIALKLNLKAGGVNHKLAPEVVHRFRNVKGEGVMVVGIDVTPAKAGSEAGSPSIAGVVANADAEFSQWPGSLRYQKDPEGLVEDLESIIKERLRLFDRTRKEFPEKMVVYRAGVSTSQYHKVLKKELPKIKAACIQVCGKAIPITMIIAGQSSQTRFYRSDDTQIQNRDGQPCGHAPEPGTIVHRSSDAKPGSDFYLQAHGARNQLNTRPAHYVVLQDESEYPLSIIEEMTHNLCYMVGSSTAAAAVCAPAHYADLLCKRGRLLLAGCVAEEKAKGKSGAKAEDKAKDAFQRGAVHDKLRDTMFYI